MTAPARDQAIDNAAQAIYTRLRNGQLANTDWTDLTEPHKATLRTAAADAYNAMEPLILGNHLIEIPCGMHRTRHTLTAREAAVVIVVGFGMTEDTALDPATFDRDHLCVTEMLNGGRDAEGYLEHVESLLGSDAIDYPDATR